LIIGGRGVPRNTTVAAKFDLFDVNPCKGFDARYKKAKVYICTFPRGKPTSESWCPDWSFVYWNSNPRGYVNPSNQYIPSGLRDKISLVRAKRTKETYKRGGNPLVLTVKNMWVNPWSAADHRDLEHFHLILGVNVFGKDPRGVFKIQFVDPAPALRSVSDATVDSFLPGTDTPDPLVTYLNLSSSDAMMQVETGFTEKNTWLDWITFTAKSNNMTDCIACSTARPTLFTSPAPLLYETDHPGFDCMLALHMNPSPPECPTLNALFPPASNTTIPPIFTPRAGNYTCLTRRNDSFLGEMPSSWCSSTINVTSWANASSLLHARADLFWYCGTKTLYNFLAPRWSGTCTLVRLAMPVVLPGHLNFSPTSGSPTYFDAIGVHQGVPDEYKLANPIANGFESIFLWITPDKNVDHINYVHFNLQRLTNLTRDALEGIATQLSASSLASWQNRMALDMLLAEKGGVALDGLRTLANQMAEDSGVQDIPDWFSSVFGKWKSFIVAGMVYFYILRF
uniref:Uncharacterized protein n=1 Tax=Cyprinodon variegatus TaxID=28743 RepID=A0A3Q2FMG1_CYPVA